MSLELWEQYQRGLGNKAAAELARVLREQYGDVSTGQSAPETSGLAESLISQEIEAWKRFFGKEINIPNPPPKLLEVLKKAEQEGLGLEAHYLPPFSFRKDSKIKGWEVRPEEWFWQKINEGEIDSEATKIDRGWILVGTNRGGFGRSWDDVHQDDLPRLANKLGVENSQVRLPKEIEFNVLGNVFHPEWGQDYKWEWFEDNFGGGDRLLGGRSGKGGLADVRCDWPGHRPNDVGFRPLVVFSPSA